VLDLKVTICRVVEQAGSDKARAARVSQSTERPCTNSFEKVVTKRQRLLLDYLSL
jgi:hypothetical protein